MQKDVKTETGNTQEAGRKGSRTILDELVAGAAEDARNRAQEVSLEELKKQVGNMRR